MSLENFCQKVRKLHSLYFHIFIFYVIFSLENFFFAHSSIKYDWYLSRPIWLIDRTLKAISTAGQKRLGSNDNEGLLYTPHIFRTGTSPSNAVLCYAGNSLFYAPFTDSTIYEMISIKLIYLASFQNQYSHKHNIKNRMYL